MLSRLVLTDFRNHADIVLTPAPGFVVLTGDNGAGKTNVLEAISLLAPGRGLRRASLAEMARNNGSGGFGVAARLNVPQGTKTAEIASSGQASGARAAIPPAGQVDLATGIEPSAPNRRIVRINGAPVPATALTAWLTVLWLTPAMDRLFVEGPAERRRFLDRLVLALVPAHATHTTRYEAAMRARNHLLAETRDSGRAPDGQWLSALEAQMAEHGAAIDGARRHAINALAAAIGAEPEGAFARATLALDSRESTIADLAQALAASRRRDAAAGRTLIGPHRSDLVVNHHAKNQPAASCSTGEQKALLLGIVLAHATLVAARTGHTPILLLDEVAAHLDPRRRAVLFERLADHAQTWLTGTERAPFDAICSASWYCLDSSFANA